MELPSGVITLVFTDIENSSELSQQLRAAFEAVREQHFEIVRAAIAVWNGIEINTAGDSLFAAFVSPLDALLWAQETQNALLMHDWQGVSLRVRIGMHTGEPSQISIPRPDYFGHAVNVAARVMSAGHGGQILLSDTTYRLIFSEPLGAITFRDCGVHRLKGVGEERLWQLLHPELPDTFPALNTLNPERHNLPHHATPYIGHDNDLRGWEEKITDNNSRLLTLTGFGGMGKTRTALHLAELCADKFEDGVWWVPLEEAKTADDLWRRLAVSLRLSIQTSMTLPEQVRQFLREKKLLLILDNTEQVARAAETVKSLLEAAPHIKILITARRVLGLRAEVVFALRPLNTEEAERLFVERAQALQDDFTLNAENAEDVSELCRELEGVPLAIELAASRIVGMSPRQMRQRLGERFRLLQTRAPDLPDRQRALRAAIDWSYDLLRDDEREVFAQLGVFTGGFSMDDAEAVCEAFDVFESVMELRNHSFFRAETDSQTQESRFLMLDILRVYAIERMQEIDDKGKAVRKRHAEYFLNYARERIAKFRTPDERPARRQLETNSANVRSAMEWANTTDDVALFAELALSFGTILQRRGFLRDACEPLQAARTALAPLLAEYPLLVAKISAELAGLSCDLSDAPAAREEAEKALGYFAQAEDTIGQATVQNLLGQAAVLDRRYADAREHYAQALTAFTAADRRIEMAIVNNNIGILEYTAHDGDRAKSRTTLEEALRLHNETQSQRGMAEAHNNLGVLAHHGEEWAAAEQHYLSSLQIRQSLRHGYGAALVLSNLGEIAQVREQLEKACQCFAAAEVLFSQSQSPYAGYAADLLLQTVPHTVQTVEDFRRTAKSLTLEQLVAWATQSSNSTE